MLHIGIIPFRELFGFNYHFSIMGKVLDTPILESLKSLKSKRSQIDNHKSSKRLYCLLLKTNGYS